MSRHPQVRVMSVIPLKSRHSERGLHVRFVPQADICLSKKKSPALRVPGLEGLRNFSDVPLLLQDDLYVPIGFCLTNTLVDFIAVVVAGMNPEGQMLLVIRTTAISPFSTADIYIAHLM